MNNDLFTYYNHLGFFNPFYFRNKHKKIECDSNYLKLVNGYAENPNVDIIAIAEILSNRFILGDRTIIEGVHRSPWLAKPNANKDNWDFYRLNKHSENFIDENDVANKLFLLVCHEIREYVGNKKKIGILLSGGMDSRIVAGCLDFLIKTNQILIESVTAYNWGNPESRDVVYAKKIADRLQWNYKHYTVTADDLWENFKISGIRGAEYSGIHLHAIPQIEKDMDVEVMLAGSYGDGIGRGEYEGIKVENLTSIKNRFKNFGGFLKENVFNSIQLDWQNDILEYHNQFPESEKYQQYELDFQLHYMRRMLNPCMEILNEKAPTHQVFTSPKVYEFMWSLHPSVRKDKIYFLMLELFETKLNDIPWARTGVPYLGDGKPDRYLKQHHSYFKTIQNELLDKIQKRIFSDRIKGIKIFNMEALKTTMHLVKVIPNRNADYLERLSWIVSMDYFLEKTSVSQQDHKNVLITEKFQAYVWSPLNYLALNVFRKFR